MFSFNNSLLFLYIQAPHSPDFHFPEPILAKIVSLISQNGVEDLKSWIRSGPDGKAAVFSPETLSSVRLDRCPDFAAWSRPTSPYLGFFSKCLAENNIYALYVHSLVLGFRFCDINRAISVVSSIKDLYPIAKLLFIMLNSCAGTEDLAFYWKFKKEHRFAEIDQMYDSLLYHINSVGPRRWGTYSRTWHFDDFPECWQEHDWLKEFNGERCSVCIYYYLSRDIMLLS